jgi:PAS domain S-box-containing protein
VVAVYDDVTSKKDVAEKISEAIAKLKDNETRFLAMFDNSAIGIVIANEPDIRITQTNVAFCELTGYTKDELIGKTVKEITHPDDWEISFNSINKAKYALHSDLPVRVEKRYIRKDGSIRWAAVFISKIEHYGGRVESFAQIVDITDRKAIQENLDMSEIRYRRLFESAKDGILILNAKTGMIVDVNPFLIELLGYSYDAFLGKKIWELGFLQDIVANQDHFIDLQKNGYVRYEDKPLKTKNGDQIDVEFISNTYEVNHEMVVQCNIRDITKRKQADIALRESQIVIEKSQLALAKANGILSVECDLARGIAAGTDGNFNVMLRKASKKLKVGWLCVVVIGCDSIMGRWTDEKGSSVSSIDEIAKLSPKDIEEIKEWAMTKITYVGKRDGMPPCLIKMSKPIGSEWMAIPVAGDKPYDLLGVVMVSARSGNQWSSSECDAMAGLATILCILAKNEKNREELSRRIDMTITEISNAVSHVDNNLGA